MKTTISTSYLLLTCCFLILFSANCTTNTKQKPAIQKQEPQTISIYEGTGIWPEQAEVKTTLTLHWAANSYQKNTYTLTKEYPTKQTVDYSGKFNTERGFKEDIDATVFILNYDKPENEQLYFVYFSNNPNILYRLDSLKKEIVEIAGNKPFLKKIK